MIYNEESGIFDFRYYYSVQYPSKRGIDRLIREWLGQEITTFSVEITLFRYTSFLTLYKKVVNLTPAEAKRRFKERQKLRLS